MVTSEGIQLNVSGDNQLATALMTPQTAQITMQQLTQAHGISLAGEGDQQILVVTDPAQFEVLQVIFYVSIYDLYSLITPIYSYKTQNITCYGT